jgi:subtilase family serine protease
VPSRLNALLRAGFAAATLAATPAVAQTGARLITDRIDDARTVALPGNVRSEANAANDRGLVAAGMTLNHMQLLLDRPASAKAALESYIAALSDPQSADFHRWLTADQFGSLFGPQMADIQDVTAWLQSKGFTVNGVQPNRMVIDFSGTAGQVQGAFGTAIHALSVGGVQHIANMSNPTIPAALSGIVRGIVSLNDFRPHPAFRPRPAYTFSSGGSTYHAVVPADLATIYNLNPLFSAGTSGQGQTIVVIEDTDVYKTADWTTFRSTLGLSGYTAGSFVQVHPTASGSSCSDPGTVAGSESEATLDAEWASASAPSAKIELASCKDTSTTFGGLIALQNLLNAGSPPAIVSISYGECEAENGATANAAYSSTYQQAVAMGVSVFVSSGDEGAASCDADLTKATHGIAVSGFASTPYNVAVGGTDFGDTAAGTTSTYWNSSNGSTYGSAKSYIPEIPWNDSCASSLLAAAAGYSTTYGTSGFCNSSTGKADYLTTASGSGGPSGCATGSPSTSGVVSGSCKGTAKPSWQSIVGNPSDGVRDIPDVSLFAANGAWGHYYVYCDSDTADQGAACTGAPSGWSGAGGTSFASPILAGIQALVNQKQGAAQGNPNPVYYAIAKSEYGSSGSASCNSSSGNAAASSCVFYDVTKGDMDVNCTGTHNCYRPSGTNGVLSTSTTAYAPAYGTTTGWDFATGLGSVNATNLVNGWAAGAKLVTAQSRAALN